MKYLRKSTSLLLLLFIVCLPAMGQTTGDSEPRLADLVRNFKTEALSVGVVTQIVGDYQFDRSGPGNGFSVAAARVSLRGALDYGFGYFVQTEFTSNPVLLDARVSYAFSQGFIVDAGMFKSPFSAEFLIPAPSIDFVNRSQVVGALAPNRQIGVGVRGATPDGLFRYNVGAFNGNGRNLSGNDNNSLLYAGRLSLMAHPAGGTLEIGGNMAYSEDDPGTTGFKGTRLLFGGDFRLDIADVLLTGELIYADLDADVGIDTQPIGYQTTLGYMVDPGRHQVLLRFDALDRDIPGLDTREFVVFGYNFWPSSPFELQFNYLLPVGGTDLDQHQVLVNFQVAF